MSTKALHLLAQLREDFELTDLQDFARRVEVVEKLLTLAPRKAKAPAITQRFKLIVSEGAQTYEVFVDGEKELDKWLTQKKKTNAALVASYFPVPHWSQKRDERDLQIQEHCSEIRAAKLNLSIEIINITQ